MASQRPSTSKSQAHLNPDAWKSKLGKELKELLVIAKNIKNESVFQQEHRYRKFKANNHIIQAHEIKPIWFIFFDRLMGWKFYKECIYWCNKILEDVRLSDSPERSLAIGVIVQSFYELEDYENVLKYGEKYLAISIEPKTTKERDMKWCTLFMMKNASRKLNRIDQFQYPKEALKINVLRYNAKEISETQLLYSYLDLINMQTEIFGDFKSANKTMKHLKLFSLNSLDSNDVIKAMGSKDYEVIFPLGHFLDDSEVVHKKKLKTDFCKRNCSDHDSLQLYYKKVELYMCISKICWKKHEILLNLCDIPISFEWGYLALDILQDYRLHLEMLEKTSLEMLEEISEEIVVPEANIQLPNIINGVAIEITGLTLLLAGEDNLNREKLFSQLFQQYGGNGYIGMSILSAQRNYSNLDVQKVMPFLEFSLRRLNKRATPNEVYLANELNEVKVQLSTFKNSLTIMNHFSNLKNTLAFQPKGTLTLFPPVES